MSNELIVALTSALGGLVSFLIGFSVGRRS